MKATLGCLHTICHALEREAGLQKAWSSQRCCVTSLSIPQCNTSPWWVPVERLHTLPIPHCGPRVLYCKGCAHWAWMSKCYRRASYWEQHFLPSMCLQCTGIPAPDGAGMRQTASWLYWNIPLSAAADFNSGLTEQCLQLSSQHQPFLGNDGELDLSRVTPQWSSSPGSCEIKPLASCYRNKQIEDERCASGTYSLGKAGKHLLTSAARLPNPQCQPDLSLFHGKMDTRRRTSQKVYCQGRIHELLLWFVAFKTGWMLQLISEDFVWLFLLWFPKKDFFLSLL